MNLPVSELNGFWNSLNMELAKLPIHLRLERDDFYSKPEWDIYRAYYVGLDAYDLCAWLSIPQRSRTGKFPILIRMADYQSAHTLIYTPLRKNAIVVNVPHRGQRLNDNPFQASYPGLLTEGIDCPEAYVMRKVIGDAVRAVDVLQGHAATSGGRVCLTGLGLGGALALTAAACRSSVAAVAADTPLMFGHPKALDAGTGYPLAEFADYLRMFPERRATIEASIAPLNLVEIAPRVTAPVLLSVGRRDRGWCPVEIGEELAAKLPRCDLRIYDGAAEGGDHVHTVLREDWLAKQLGG